MNIVVATNRGSLYGKKLLNEFLRRGVEAKAVMVIDQPPSYYLKLFKYVWNSVGFADAVYFLVRRIAEAGGPPSTWKGGPFISTYKEMGMPVVYAKGINSRETRELLEACRPDLLILAQTGIVRKEILDVPTRGTLNAHPGILPCYRGIDCEKWAIYEGNFDAVGCTVHWVDSGVDRGPIVRVEQYAIQPDDNLRTLTGNLYDLAVRMLADVVVELEEGAALDVIEQKGPDGRQYHKMSRRQERIVRRKLIARTTGTSRNPL